MAVINDMAAGYGLGRAIGDDISRVRFNRGEQKVREKYAELAEQEGKPLQAYMPQIEAEIQQLGSGMFGVDRRGVRGEGGQSFSAGALGRLSRDVLIGGERAAGAQALAGDQQGARATRAQTLYGMGRFDDAQAQQIAGATIGATNGAIGADGQYDPTKGAQSMGAISAQFGDQAGAERNAQVAPTFRLQAAGAMAGRLATAFQNPGTTSPDQIAGLYAGLRDKVPELGNTELRVGEDGTWNIYADGSKTATGSFNPKDPSDQTELMDMLSSFSRDPGTVVQQYQQARLKSISDAKTRDNDIEGKFMDARIKAVDTLTKDVGIPAEVVNKMFSGTGSGSSGSTGWQLQEIGADASTYMIQKGGNVYVVKTNVAADPAKGELGGPVQVFEADGVTPVPASALNASERKEISSMATSVAGELAKGNFEAKVEAVNATLNALGSMEAQYRGQKAPAPARVGGSRADRNGNPGNIEDRGQFANDPDYLGNDGRFARFREGSDAGARAMANQLERYMDGKTRTANNPNGAPRTTVADIVSQWSPQNDPTNEAGSTANYARYVAQRLGVDPGAQLTKADIPRLSQAMSEFESGNTARGVIAPRRGGIDVAAAEAAPTPAATAPTQRTRISEDYVRGAAGDLRTMAAEYDQKRAALERFEAENSSSPTAAFASNREGAMPQMGRRYQSPEQQRVGDRLRQEVAQAEAALRAATGELRENTGALKQQSAQATENQRAAELARRYDPGMADFFGQLR